MTVAWVPQFRTQRSISSRVLRRICRREQPPLSSMNSWLACPRRPRTRSVAQASNSMTMLILVAFHDLKLPFR